MIPSNMQPLDWLMVWYSSQCNGDWEHQNGIKRVAAQDSR